MTSEMWHSCLQISHQLHQRDLCNAKRTAAKLQSRNRLLQIPTQRTWEELIVLISFVPFILLVGSVESGIDTFFWFLFNLSVCNSFVLSSVHRGRKGTMFEFHLELAKQLINGFSQRKRKRRLLEGPNASVVGLQEHVSVKVEGRKRKCVQCIKAGRRTPKGCKIET